AQSCGAPPAQPTASPLQPFPPTSHTHRSLAFSSSLVSSAEALTNNAGTILRHLPRRKRPQHAATRYRHTLFLPTKQPQKFLFPPQIRCYSTHGWSSSPSS